MSSIQLMDKVRREWRAAWRLMLSLRLALMRHHECSCCRSSGCAPALARRGTAKGRQRGKSECRTSHFRPSGPKLAYSKDADSPADSAAALRFTIATCRSGSGVGIVLRTRSAK